MERGGSGGEGRGPRVRTGGGRRAAGGGGAGSRWCDPRGEERRGRGGSRPVLGSENRGWTRPVTERAAVSALGCAAPRTCRSCESPAGGRSKLVPRPMLLRERGYTVSISGAFNIES